MKKLTAPFRAFWAEYEPIIWGLLMGAAVGFALCGCTTHEQRLEDWFRAKNAQPEVFR